MKITDKADHDPVTDLALVDIYMRWALQAAEEVVGKQGLGVVLRQNGLERFVDNYPSNEVKANGTRFRDYANFMAGLHSFYGRAGKSMALRIGRLSAKYTIEQEGAKFGLTAVVAAAKLLPLPMQMKMGLETNQGLLRKMSQSIGEDLRMRVEDRGDKFAYINEDCALCAGKQADEKICWVFNGALQEGLKWQTGKEFEIAEVECRAQGAPACVWEISKTPKA